MDESKQKDRQETCKSIPAVAQRRSKPKRIDHVHERERYLTPPEIASRLRVTPYKVLGWIRRAELRAINVGDGYRPRYRISPADFEDFLTRRTVQPPPRIERRRRQPPEGGPLDPELGKKLARQGKATLVFGTYYRVWNDVIQFY